MKNVVIISKVYSKDKDRYIGDELGSGVVWFFGKSSSRRMRDKLNKEFKEEDMDCICNVDQSYKSARTILKNAADILLISPIVRDFVDFSGVIDGYYLLDEDEYENTEISGVIEYLKGI
ncbi:MAG: hypothetical protein ACRCWG_06095 [Sarcina sp.]